MLRASLKIHFVSGHRQTKTALSSDKADLSWLPEAKNLLLSAQKQLLELPLIYYRSVIIPITRPIAT